MLTDGLQLLGTSTVVNLRVGSGVTFPVAASTGELFFQNGVGLHVYDGTDWTTLSTVVTPGLATATTGSTTVDVAGYEVIRITMNANTTLNLTGGVNGQKITLELVQDDTGSRVLTLGTSFRFGTNLTTILLSTAANKIDRIGVIYNSSASKYDIVAFVKGF